VLKVTRHRAGGLRVGRDNHRKVLVLAGAAVLAAMSLAGVTGGALAAGSGKVDPAKLPKSLHGAVETKALTFGTVAPPIVPSVGSVLLDPGPAYAYSTLDRDDYGDGNVNFTMTARGANVDGGPIAGAAMWAPANCDDPNAQLPCALRNPIDPITDPKRESGSPPKQGDVGLETAAGFPFYAEALFPDQPPPAPSRQRVYKCLVNKDANGAQPTQGSAQSFCKQGGDSVPMTAWAEAVGDDVRSEGFSRAEGFASPGIFSVGPSESHSLVQPETDGSLHSMAYSTINSIDIGGGQIRIDQVRSEGDIKSTADKVLNSSGSCTLSGLTIGGQRVQQTSGGEIDASGLKPLLDGVEAATKLRVEITPPKPAQSTTVEGSKHVVSCAGLKIAITDERTQSLVPVCSPASPPQPPPDSGLPPAPSCVPPLGVRYELSFGSLSVQEAVNAFAGGSPDAGGGGAPTSVLGNDLGSNPSVPPDVGTGGLGVGGPAGLAQTPFASPRSVGTGGNGTANVQNAAGIKFVDKNLAEVAALTAGSAAAFGLCVWFLLGVVDSVAKGTPLKLPGL
jgi:hypothetical protein